MHKFASSLAAFGFACTCTAASQDYPSRLIVMIAPFAAGAPVDIVGRIVAERMRTTLGQPVVVENASGAAGSVGTGRVASAPNDGYTIGIGNVSSHVLNGAVYDLQFDVLRDFEPIALLASNPQLLLSRKSLPANDLQNLIIWLRANADRATAGTGGVGGISDAAGVLSQRDTATRFQFVPYRASNLAQQELIGGHIDLMFEQAVAAVTNVRSGKVKAYA